MNGQTIIWETVSYLCLIKGPEGSMSLKYNPIYLSKLAFKVPTSGTHRLLSKD